MSPLPSALDPRQLALPPGAQAMLHIFMTDLVCFVPETDKLWVLAPHTDNEAKHAPTLFFCGATITNGSAETRQEYGGEPVWLLNKEDLTIEGGFGDLRVIKGDRGGRNTPDMKGENGLEWLPHVAELNQETQAVTVRSDALAGTTRAGDLVAGRLQIEQGRVHACNFTMNGTWARRIQFGSLVPPDRGGRPRVVQSGIEPRVYATTLLAAVPLSAPEVTFRRRSFGAQGASQTITLVPANDSRLIEVVFANYGPDLVEHPAERAEEHDGAKHFEYHYQLLNGWQGPKFVPNRNEYESRLGRRHPSVKPASLGTLEALCERLKLYQGGEYVNNPIASMTQAGFVKNCIPLVSDPPGGGG